MAMSEMLGFYFNRGNISFSEPWRGANAFDEIEIRADRRGTIARARNDMMAISIDERENMPAISSNVK